MSATWMHMMNQICPEYDKLASIPAQKISVIAIIDPHDNQWRLTIRANRVGFWVSEMMNNPISWAEKKLEGQKNVLRHSRNSWTFLSKEDAEQFRTLFYLSWDQSDIN